MCLVETSTARQAMQKMEGSTKKEPSIFLSGGI